jgi:hypothetical protein
VGISPHRRVLSFFFPASAEPQSQGPQGTYQSPADFSVSPQPAAESSHRLDDFFIPSAQFLLPDRKNRLASMETLHQHLDSLLSHLLQGHRFALLKSESVFI